jgi:hypothetical protein
MCVPGMAPGTIILAREGDTMKKGFILFFSLLVLGNSVFGEIVFHGFGQGIFTPVFMEKPQAGDALWTAGMGRIDQSGIPVTFSLSGSYEDVIGLYFDFEQDTTEDTRTYSANFWIKPFPWLKATFNDFEDTSLCLPVGLSTLAPWIGRSDDDEAVFSSFVGNPGKGFLLGIDPPIPYMEAVFIGARLNVPVSLSGKPDTDIEDAYKSVHVAGSYSFWFGKLRLGVFGPQKNESRADKLGAMQFEAGFSTENELWDLAGVPGKLIVQTGVKIPLADNEDSSVYQKPYMINLGGKWEYKKFSVLTQFNASFGGYEEDKPNDIKNFKDMNWWIFAHGDYYANSKFSLGFDINLEFIPRYIEENLSTGQRSLISDANYVIAFAPSISISVGKNFSRGKVVLAPAFKMPTEVEIGSGFYKPFEFSLPIIFEYWF